MSDIFRSAVEQYARILPQDLLDTEVYMNATTRVDFESAVELVEYPGLDYRLLGLPVRIDDNMPDGIVRLRTENVFDRAIRRANEQGRVFNIAKPVPFMPEELPAPSPTLRALVKHWWKRVRRG